MSVLDHIELHELAEIKKIQITLKIITNDEDN
jgi:hypothetical protein